VTIATELAIPAEAQNRPSRRRRARDQRVKRFRRAVLVAAPELDDPRFAPLVASFSRISILGLDAYEFLRANGIMSEEGELRSSVDTVNRLIGAQLKLANALGLAPAALGKLRNERPIDLAAHFAQKQDDGTE